MNVIKGFLIAFSMFSKIPVPNVKWEESNIKYVFCFFPFIGLVIGLIEFVWFSVAQHFGLNNFMFGAVAALIPVAITGGIHIDGFMDTSDALGSYRDREKMLEILEDSHVGAFAVISTVIYFLLFFGAMTCISYKWQALMCAVVFFLSRSAAVCIIMGADTSKNTGLLYTFKSGASKVVTGLFSIVFIFISVGALEVLNIGLGIITAIAVLLTSVYFSLYIMKKFGGISGDLAGWFISVSELVAVLAIGIGGVIL